MSKLPIPTGPSEIFRRMQPVSAKSVKARAVPIARVKAEVAKIAPRKPHPRRDEPPEPVEVAPMRPKSGSDGGEVALLTKTRKVKAWREANPEAYADQKRRSVEKRAKLKAQKGET